MSLEAEERIDTLNSFTTKELMTVIYEIRERVTRIEERQSRVDKLEEKADIADSKASEALLIAKDSQKRLDQQKVQTRWAWGTIATIIVGVVGVIFHFI